jgi:hypothetical protein
MSLFTPTPTAKSKYEIVRQNSQQRFLTVNETDSSIRKSWALQKDLFKDFMKLDNKQKFITKEINAHPPPDFNGDFKSSFYDKFLEKFTKENNGSIISIKKIKSKQRNKNRVKFNDVQNNVMHFNRSVEYNVTSNSRRKGHVKEGNKSGININTSLDTSTFITIKGEEKVKKNQKNENNPILDKISRKASFTNKSNYSKVIPELIEKQESSKKDNIKEKDNFLSEYSQIEQKTDDFKINSKILKKASPEKPRKITEDNISKGIRDVDVISNKTKSFHQPKKKTSDLKLLGLGITPDKIKPKKTFKAILKTEPLTLAAKDFSNGNNEGERIEELYLQTAESNHIKELSSKNAKTFFQYKGSRNKNNLPPINSNKSILPPRLKESEKSLVSSKEMVIDGRLASDPGENFLDLIPSPQAKQKKKVFNFLCCF